MKKEIQIEPGICNFGAVVSAESEDCQNVTFEFTSECATIQEFAEQVKNISPVDAIATLGPDENEMLSIARGLLQTKGCCEACIVPAAAVKIMQVATNLALPKEVSMKMSDA